MTSVTDVYDAFLSKVLDDEWVNWTWEEVQEDFDRVAGKGRLQRKLF